MKISVLKNSLILSLASLGALAGLTACNGSGVGGTITIDPILYAWYDTYGGGCATAYQGPRPGCNFYIYGSDLVKIMDFEDEYFDDSNLVVDKVWNYYLDGYSYQYVGWGWQSPNGIIYDYNGNALNKKKGSGGRDIVRSVAKAENAVVEKAGKELAARYSLSASKGVQIARTLNDWARIGKSRAKTEKDFSEFSQKLYGVDYLKVKKAVLAAAAGDRELMQQTVAQAARNWGTNEETMKQVLRTWYKGQVPGLE